MSHAAARRFVLIGALAIVASLAFGGVAMAGYGYPDPGQPQGGGGGGKAKTGKRKTLKVCKRGCKYKSLQKAVNKAKAGDKITIAPGKYKGGAVLRGSGKDRITIIGKGKGKRKSGKRGAPPSARKVVLDGKGFSKNNPAGDNGILAIDVDGLVIRNISANNFRSNGFFIRGLDDSHPCTGYTLDDLYASNNKGYGLYTFNCLGGSMTDSTGTLSGDSGFYIGAIPSQASPKRALVDEISSFKNAQGWSGTNMRYVTIRNSDFFNNGLGLSLSVLDSEPFKPNANNIIENSRFFWNNEDLYATSGPKKPPYVPAGIFTEFLPYHVPGTGDGIWLLGGDNNIIRNNEIFGNYLHGIGIVEPLQGVVLDPTKAIPPGKTYQPTGNQITGNKFGRNGTDKNGADLSFATTVPATGNCWSNAGQTIDTVGGGTYPGCPFNGTNPALPSQVNRVLGIALGNPSSFWVRRVHPAIPGFTPFPSNPQ